MGMRIMDKFRTVVSLIIMLVSAFAGFMIGAFLDNNAVGGAILFSLISGISCIIYTIDNPRK